MECASELNKPWIRSCHKKSVKARSVCLISYLKTITFIIQGNTPKRVTS